MSATGTERSWRGVRQSIKGVVSPVALSFSETVRVTRMSSATLARLVRERRIEFWRRDGQVRIPLFEVERLTVRARPSMPETARRR